MNGRKDTWEVYSEYAGGYVRTHGKGLTKEEAYKQAFVVADYDCHEMGEPTPAPKEDENSVVWYIPGSIVGAYREWEEEV